MESEEVFGTRVVLMLLGIGLAYLLFLLAPVIWPAQRAFRRSKALPRPWLFVTISALIVYGMLTFVMLCVFVPLSAHSTFIAPQLSAGDPDYKSLTIVVSDFVERYAWIVVPLAQLALSAWITSKLARRWPKVAVALND